MKQSRLQLKGENIGRIAGGRVLKAWKRNRRKRLPINEDLSPDLVVPQPVTRDRIEVLRRQISSSSKLLEIGPLTRPIAAKRDGFDVYIVDKFDRDTLRENYSYIGEDLELIEEVDFVWGDTDLAAAIPDCHHGTFDCIIMSHVLEHSPDPISLLQSCSVLLKPGGTISLAHPDKRFCFDALRPISTTGEWIQAFKEKRIVHSPKALFDYASYAVAHERRISWKDQRPIGIETTTFVSDTLAGAYQANFTDQFQNDYRDCHAWVFTPASFALAVQECHALGLLHLSLEFVSSTVNDEFFAYLKLEEKKPISHHDRLQLLCLSAVEQSQGFGRFVAA